MGTGSISIWGTSFMGNTSVVKCAQIEDPQGQAIQSDECQAYLVFRCVNPRIEFEFKVSSIRASNLKQFSGVCSLIIEIPPENIACIDNWHVACVRTSRSHIYDLMQVAMGGADALLGWILLTAGYHQSWLGYGQLIRMQPILCGYQQTQ